LNRLVVFAGAAGLLACGGAVESNNAATANSSTAATKKIPYTPIHGGSSVGREQGGWMVDSSTDKMDDVTNVTLMLLANDPLNLPFPYRDAVPSLVIRCEKRKTELYVITHTPVETSRGSDSRFTPPNKVARSKMQ